MNVQQEAGNCISNGQSPVQSPAAVTGKQAIGFARRPGGAPQRAPVPAALLLVGTVWAQQHTQATLLRQGPACLLFHTRQGKRFRPLPVTHSHKRDATTSEEARATGQLGANLPFNTINP